MKPKACDDFIQLKIYKCTFNSISCHTFKCYKLGLLNRCILTLISSSAFKVYTGYSWQSQTGRHFDDVQPLIWTFDLKNVGKKTTHRKKTTRTPLQTGDAAETRHHITVVKSHGKECWSWASGEMLITSPHLYGHITGSVIPDSYLKLYSGGVIFCLCRQGWMKRNPLKKDFLKKSVFNSGKNLTSLTALQNSLCKTLCSACSFCGGTSPVLWSLSSSSTARLMSVKKQTQKHIQLSNYTHCPF